MYVYIYIYMYVFIQYYDTNERSWSKLKACTIYDLQTKL